MAESILRLKVESQEYDAKLKRAAEGLNRYVENCRKVGGTLEVVEKDTLEFVRSMGQMETTAKTATGKLSEMKRTFQEWGMVYKQMTDAEKQSPVGKALSQSLDQLKGRIQETKRDMQSLEQELNGSKFGQFGSVIDGIGQKMGINANLTELLTSKTALMSAGIGASVAIIGKATEEWTKYNSELAKQDQITTVTTGLKGSDSDRMTDQARALVDTYSVDFREAINAANTLMTQFGKSGEEAMDLIRQGMQGMIQGDGPKLLSMIQQYAPSFRDAGIEASQLVAIIQNSEGGIFTDQNMNAIVMGIKNIRLMTKATSDALAQLGIDGQKMSKDLSDGTITIFEAMKQVVDQLQKAESGSQTAGEVMQQVFGRQGTAAGTNLAKAIATLNTNLEETKRQTGDLGQSYDSLYEANVQLNQAIRACFGYTGWEQMATGIKTKLITTLADVLNLTAQIKESWVGDVGRTMFDFIADSAKMALGPLNSVLTLLSNINSVKNSVKNSIAAGENGWSGVGKYYDTRRLQRYINNGKSTEDKIKRYDESLKRIDNLIARIGKEYKVKNSDGSTSFVIDDKKTQNEKRQELLAARKALYASKYTEPAQSTSPLAPLQPSPKMPVGSSYRNVRTGTGFTPAQQAARNIEAAEQEYSRALEKAALEVKDGEINEAQEKKKQLDALKSLWSAYGKASDMVNGSNADYKDKQESLGKRIVELGGEIVKTTEAKKIEEEQARKNADAWKKLEASSIALYAAQDSNDLKAFYKAREQYKAAGGGNQLDPSTFESSFTATTANIEAFIGNLKERIANSDVGTDLYNSLTAQLADATALSNLLQVAIKNGIDPEQIGLNPQEFWSKVFGENPGDYIKDETWQDIVDKMNSYLKEKGIQIGLDTNVGSINTKNKQNPYLSKRDDGKTEAKLMNVMSGISSGIGSIVSGIEQMGIDIPKELKGGISAIQGITSILSGIATTALVIESLVAADMVMFAHGGIVHAANGWVGGNRYSADDIPVAVSSGELILNKAQQGNLASQLQSGEGGGGQHIVGVLKGEDIVLIADRWGKRTGRGELLFAKNL